MTTATRARTRSIFDPSVHDVVITDLGMPKTTGWEVAERIKSKSPETPVFLLTGWGEACRPTGRASSSTA